MPDGCRLYIITPETFELRTLPDLFARALDAGDVAAVQLRLKNVADDDWKRAVDALRPIAQAHDVAFVLNDRADLVVAIGCDGAHVGQEDTPAREARRLMGAGRAGRTSSRSSAECGTIPTGRPRACARSTPPSRPLERGHDR